MQTKEWFKDWFNSPFYHVLYQHRNDVEAQLFIDNLIHYLELKPQAKILDLACGRGRHSRYLNSKGFTVIGADYSTENILFAKQFESENLQFLVHDMRKNISDYQFDCVMNLFTSFGYFDTASEDLDVLKQCKCCLNDNGVFVLDFHNTSKILNSLVNSEAKTISGIKFEIERELKNGFLYKNIEVVSGKSKHLYYEKVRAIAYTEFLEMFKKAGFNVKAVFGNYNLDIFDEANSERMVFVLTK
jgi:SAM-dependent methyltransferase